MKNKEINGYLVKNIKYKNTRRGVSYTADLLQLDKTVAQITNDGDGGSTVARFIDKADIRHYIDTAKSCCIKSFEPNSDFAELLINQAESL